jgi:hypothetical protein
MTSSVVWKDFAQIGNHSGSEKSCCQGGFITFNPKKICLTYAKQRNTFLTL